MLILLDFAMNKLVIIGIAALVIATAVVATQQAAFANRDGGDRINQEGKCRNCQQQQAVNNEDSLNTEARSSGDGDAIANGGMFQSRTGGG
jgi:hypothetical protein